MTRISASDLVFRPATGSTTTATSTASSTSADALRRLQLEGDAGKSWPDVLSLRTDEFADVVRTIDGERALLEHNYAGATVIDTTLTAVLAKLDDADKLVTANGRSGVDKYSRRQNQSDLDKIIKAIDQALKDARMPDTGDPLFDGNITLTAGSGTAATDTLDVPKTSTHTLGHTYGNGHAMSLKDLVRHGLLDTSKESKLTIDDAQKVIQRAKDNATEMVEQARAFQKEKLVPRLGDVATTFEGIYKSSAAKTLVNSSTAQDTATQLRQILVDSTSLAAAVGADGWDKDRIVELLS
jgi:hypothetical protein